MAGKEEGKKAAGHAAGKHAGGQRPAKAEEKTVAAHAAHAAKEEPEAAKHEKAAGGQAAENESAKHDEAGAKEHAKPAAHGKAAEKGGKQAAGAGKAKKAKAREPWPEMPRVAKSKEVKRLARLVRKKKRLLFRGRFGNKAVRNITDKKWQRWRKPQGADIYFKKEDGLVVGIGYGTSREIRGVHPSGYRERLVRNVQELEAMAPEKAAVAARIGAKVGAKKKKEILRKAGELGVFVLNA
ncbi:MAG: hypothetical protein NTW59_01435 [Candidatus Diapherotrites archaeon]|nr:hypothetical protein [Candidatus Diapherotrites archaeon]